MDIGKTAIASGSDLATAYGQKAELAGSREAEPHRGEKPQVTADAKTGGAAAVMVEISPEALERSEQQEALQVVREHYANLPDAREDVVARVKQGLAEGYYDTDGVKEQLADRLMALGRSWSESAP